MRKLMSKMKQRILSLLKILLKKLVKLLAILLAIIFFVCVIPCYINLNTNNKVNTQFDSSKLEIHLIDVGQAEAILVVQGENVMLVDTGKIKSSAKLVKYIKNLGIDEIDVLVISHLHEDHAGGTYEIINSFHIGQIYISDAVRNENIATKLWYTGIHFSKIINQIVSMKIIPYDGPKDDNGNFINFNLGDAYVEFLGPIDDKSEIINNTSIITKVTFRNKSILLMGDAEEDEEYELIESGANLKADILKVSHHGSGTSSVMDFINLVDPEYALISAEKFNMNSHPVKRVMRQFEKLGIDVYRTDESGTIVVTIGDEISFNTSPGDYRSGREIRESEMNLEE